MALLRLALVYASGRPVHALIIDHGLREGSGHEAKETARRAADMGALPQIALWDHSGIKTAIQEKARTARYGLLADMCREIGVNKLLTGHNEDDQAETVAMRQSSGSGWRGLAGIKPVITEPIWPQTMGLTVGRPLIETSRAAIREYCAAHGVPYLDDPSNSDARYERVRVRADSAANPQERAQMLTLGKAMSARRQAEDDAVDAWLSRSVLRGYGGATSVSRDALPDMPAAALADLLRLASGQARRPDMTACEALAAHLTVPHFKQRTLGGAIVYAGGDHIHITREPGAVLGRRNQRAARFDLPALTQRIWDGRFSVSTIRDAVHVAPAWLGRGQLSKPALEKLRVLPAPVRRTLPGFFDHGVLLAVPALSFKSVKEVCRARDITTGRFPAIPQPKN